MWNHFNEQQNFDLGYLVISMLFIYISAMLGIVIWGLVKAAYWKLRKYRIKRAYLKERALRKKELEKRHKRKKAKWIDKLWKRDNLTEIKKAYEQNESEESIDMRDVVFSIHCTSTESEDNNTESLVTSYEE